MGRAFLRVSVALLATACGKNATDDPAPAPAAPVAAPLTAPAVLPASFAAADYLGAAACAECHAEIYTRWQASPHGRAMALPAAATVVGDFSGTVTLADGTVTPSRDGEQFFMEMRSGSHQEKHRVDLVLASGKQHQLYAVRGADGSYTLLPIIWSARVRRWLPLSLYQAADLDPRSSAYWRGGDLIRGCLTCHLSQMYRRVGADGGQTTWVDLSVNCESCHGPGREHVARRRAGRTDEVYRDLAALGSEQEARVCGQCHGFQLRPYAFPPAADGLPQIFVTSLLNQSLRPDGTQRLTSYQYPGHVLSGGYRLQVLTCNDCHQPHDLDARDHKRRSAEPPYTNRQCTACHPAMEKPKALTAHSHHSAKVGCPDCHMPLSWIGDDDRRQQQTSDHSIASPRPRETLELGTPNACNRCHADKSPEWSLAALERWGQHEATEVREWVRTIDRGRKRTADATDRLLALLADGDSGPYLQASALDLLAIQPPAARVVPAVAPFARSPDPNLRAVAIRALLTHDPGNRQRWQETGLADAHPYVRMDTFAIIRDGAGLAEAAFDRNLADTLAYASPPTDGLVHLITLRHQRGENAEALALLDLLARVALPAERRRLNLDGVRQNLVQAGPPPAPGRTQR